MAEIDMLPDWEIMLRLLVAAGLGSLIGLERERLLWTAGIRTHMVVCVGACLIMMVSSFGFADILGANSNNVVLDPSRVAAQVVSGIGFLGAGSILLRGSVVRGLTTAASIWTVAGIGLAVGGGLYFAATSATAIILVILAGLKPIEEAYRARHQACGLHIRAERGKLTPDILRKTLSLRNGQVKRFIAQSSKKKAEETVHAVINQVSSASIASFGERLEALAFVRSVRVERPRHPGRAVCRAEASAGPHQCRLRRKPARGHRRSGPCRAHASPRGRRCAGLERTRLSPDAACRPGRMAGISQSWVKDRISSSTSWLSPTVRETSVILVSSGQWPMNQVS
jgi:putative Mg2+ transporter-C (MgtC) family protein